MPKNTFVEVPQPLVVWTQIFYCFRFRWWKFFLCVSIWPSSSIHIQFFLFHRTPQRWEWVCSKLCRLCTNAI